MSSNNDIDVSDAISMGNSIAATRYPREDDIQRMRGFVAPTISLRGRSSLPDVELLRHVPEIRSSRDEGVVEK